MSLPDSWFHLDMDAFYAAVEQRDNPAYAGKPVIVGALPGHRGVVSTCSYEARTYGVHSAMPISHAYRLCPQGIYVIPRMDYYSKISQQIMAVFADFTPRIIQVSIDEAFLDMKGAERLFGPPEESALALKKRVFETVGLTISVGVATNKLIAKMASGYKKPDGLTIVPPGEEQDFIRNLEIRDLWGIGKKTQQRLSDLNLTTIDQLLQIPQQSLTILFGQATGQYLYQVLRGIDPGIYEGQSKSHSISNEHTYPRDITHRGTVEQTLLELSHSILFRLLGEQSRSHVLQLKIRFADFTTSTAQTTLDHPIRSLEETHRLALSLLKKRWTGGQAIRLIGLGFSQVEPDTGAGQGELFAQEDMDIRRHQVEKAVLGIRSKFNPEAIQKASLLSPKSPKTPTPPKTAKPSRESPHQQKDRPDRNQASGG
ncbi:DNA polymerase IV [Spirochaeta lutea]|uniref:DNA polymerase IV n=1 Tax=Spirochaeta lutea TaxID=1480694 RepID=UPI0007A73236|nr:DNA polymerase IV [Spirochaeta lutea]